MRRRRVYFISLVLFLSLIQLSIANEPDPNLMGWWKLDEGTGVTAFDASGHGLDGILYGDPAWDSGSPYDGSGFLLLDGDDDFIDINYPSDPVLELPLYTVALWFRADSDNRSILFAGYTYIEGENPDFGILLELRNDGSLRCTHQHPFGENNRERLSTDTSYADGIWHHVALVRASDTSLSFYIDGTEVAASTDVTSPFDAPIRVVLGSNDHFRNRRNWEGAIEDVRIYNRPLSEIEIKQLANLKTASNPMPSDDGLEDQTELTLQWDTGVSAAMHDVFFADNRGDVNDAGSSDPMGPEEVYKARQVDASYALTGLERGQTYYWRIDEVNDPNSWRGPIWSFVVQPFTAYNPGPADGASLIEPDDDLVWRPGVGVLSHDVYLGTNWEDVNNAVATSGTRPQFKGNQDPCSFDPGTLAVDQTYFWRIDEVNDTDVKKGNVWSFTTTPNYYEVLTGNYSWVHDPSIIKQDGTYYVYYTAPGTPFRTSTDLHNWSWGGSVWPSGPPAWTWVEVPDFDGNIWAPDVEYFNGRYHLYYSISSFGSNHSCIGMATNTTLNPSDPDYKWVDSGGPVIRSYRQDNYNAIDPSVFIDDQGPETAYWLAFGSFWSGIKLTQLDPATGFPASDPPVLFDIADRNATGSSAIEAPVIVFKNGFYYLFVSFDSCCRGVDSTYNVRFGRATSVTGPYVDRDGVPMLMGGGTQLTFASPKWKGPGHNDILMDDDGKDWIVHHAYDVDSNGAFWLRIRRLFWTEDGWPTLIDPDKIKQSQ